MRLMSAIAAAAVVTAAAVTMAPEASAQRNRDQATTVVVVNYQRVLAESALGRDMAAKLQQIRTQIQTEANGLAPEGQSIEQERARLQQASRNMTAEQIRNNSNLNSQFEALQTRIQQFQVRQGTLQGDLECSQAFALRDFQSQASPVVRSAMEARGAGVVLDSGSIQFVTPTYDITTTVIQQLDQAARTSNTTRHALSECQGQAGAAPAGQ
jgi:Skp family chaperone for outer membrane proteins